MLNTISWKAFKSVIAQAIIVMFNHASPSFAMLCRARTAFFSSAKRVSSMLSRRIGRMNHAENKPNSAPVRRRCQGALSRGVSHDSPCKPSWLSSWVPPSSAIGKRPKINQINIGIGLIFCRESAKISVKINRDD